MSLEERANFEGIGDAHEIYSIRIRDHTQIHPEYEMTGIISTYKSLWEKRPINDPDMAQAFAGRGADINSLCGGRLLYCLEKIRHISEVRAGVGRINGKIK
jgi:hypothetical protein